MDRREAAVTIADRDGRPIGTGWLASADVRREQTLRAPLWMLCLDERAGIQFVSADGSTRRVHLREVISMNGTIATVRVRFDAPASEPLATG